MGNKHMRNISSEENNNGCFFIPFRGFKRVFSLYSFDEPGTFCASHNHVDLDTFDSLISLDFSKRAIVRIS